MLVESPSSYHYKVGDRIFSSKMLGAIHSTETGKPLTFHFHDDVWDTSFGMYKFNPMVDLENLYKQRALQIRAKYDYLVLHFSGGADSTTILETFLKNNIKLDEIFVLIPKKILGTHLHNPNITDTSATNMLSEWDFVIKPKLDFIRANYPDIKIVVHDWTDTLTDVKINTDLLIKQNHNFGLPNLGFNESFSPSNHEFEGKGIRVGNIVGIDKPFLLYHPALDKYSTCFIDVTLVGGLFQHGYGKIDLDSKVYFYYSPDYPELTIARAYVAANFFKQHPEYRHLIDNSIRKTSSRKETMFRARKADLFINSVLYPKWNINTFQVEKPDNFNKVYHPWFDYVYRTSDFERQRTQLAHTIQEFSSFINLENKTADDKGNMLGLKILVTKQFFLDL